jgi:hypothetical protein
MGARKWNRRASNGLFLLGLWTTAYLLANVLVPWKWGELRTILLPWISQVTNLSTNWMLPSPGIYRGVHRMWTDVSEESMAFILRVKIGWERNQLVPGSCKLCIKPVCGLDNYKFVDLATCQLWRFGSLRQRWGRKINQLVVQMY